MGTITFFTVQAPPVCFRQVSCIACTFFLVNWIDRAIVYNNYFFFKKHKPYYKKNISLTHTFHH